MLAYTKKKKNHSLRENAPRIMGAQEHGSDAETDTSSSLEEEEDDDDFYYCERARLNLHKCR